MARLTVCTVDFESFWSVSHSLTKMSPIAYVMHPETEIISCAAKVGRDMTCCTFGEDRIDKQMRGFDWSDKLVVAHNMSGFDAMILAWRFGVKPAMYACTLAMSRPIHAKDAGGSLAALVKHYGLGVKDQTALVNTKGKHLKDFTPDEIEAMRKYNIADTDQCHELFKRLLPLTSKDEMRLIDMTIRMLVEPQFEVDRKLLADTLWAERDRKKSMLLDLGRTLGIDYEDDEETANEVCKTLGSAARFSRLLEDLGVEVPTKISPTTGKPAPALAKTDEAFIALQEHDNPLVAAAAQARLGVKSTLLETRIEAFLQASDATGGKLPVPLKYYGADTTGRWSGWAYNPQNLIRVCGKPSDALRNSLTAGPGKKIVVADLSGIELRVNHFLWKVPSSMALYQADPDKADLYKDFAHKFYGVPIDAVSKQQRQVGKVCLAEGTLVLTDRGEVPIEEVTASDRVWDGVEYAYTLGAVYNGEREVIYYDGIEATPDHEVWVEDGRKVQIGYAAAQLLRLARTGNGGTPLGFGGTGVEGFGAPKGSSVRDSTVHAVWDYEAGCVRQPESREDAGVSVMQAEVRRSRVAASADGSCEAAVHEPERPSVPSVRGAGDNLRFSISSCRSGVGVAELGASEGQGTGSGEQQRRLFSGEPTVGYATTEHGEPSGIAHETLPLVSAGTPGDTVRGLDAATTNESRTYGPADSGALPPHVSKAKRRVWDLLECGHRHRFTANGRLVSNCHLGLGFGAGAATFQKVAKLMGGVDITLEESRDIVAKWRRMYLEIADGWKTCHAALEKIFMGVEEPIDPWGLCWTCKEGIRTPKGIIRYPDLRQETTDDGKTEWCYGQGRNKARIYAGKIDENLAQNLARNVIADQALEIQRRFGLSPALMVHDELVYVVPEGEAEEALANVQSVMRTPPVWWPELVVWSEGDIADTYGAAK